MLNGKSAEEPAEEVTEEVEEVEARPGYIGSWKVDAFADSTDIGFDSENMEIANKKDDPIDEAEALLRKAKSMLKYVTDDDATMRCHPAGPRLSPSPHGAGAHRRGERAQKLEEQVDRRA